MAEEDNYPKMSLRQLQEKHSGYVNSKGKIVAEIFSRNLIRGGGDPLSQFQKEIDDYDSRLSVIRDWITIKTLEKVDETLGKVDETIEKVDRTSKRLNLLTIGLIILTFVLAVIEVVRIAVYHV